MLVIALFAVAALFALALVWRLGVHAKGLRAARLSWRAWGALGLGALLSVIGRPLAGFVFISLGLVLAWPQDRPHRPFEQPAPQELEAARALLGLGPSADASTIRAAYRTKIARAHPDVGGDGAAADALAKARDLLLKTLQ